MPRRRERSTTDPVNAMLLLGDRFMEQAERLDERVDYALSVDAKATDISILKPMADSDRMRALACYSAASPYRKPRLQAIECVPPAPSTVERFRERIADMSEDEIIDSIRKVEAGASAIALIEAHESAGGSDAEA
jgi:hypothetical protein